MSRLLLENHPTGEVTVTDINPESVARMAGMLPLAPFVPFVHDGVISSLRTYSGSALRALARHADPAIEVTLSGGLLSEQVVRAHRAR